MRLFRYILLLLAAAAVAGVAVTGCARGQEDTGISIGISKIVTHPALDAIEQGIQDGLTELGVENVTYDLQNANGEITAAASIAQKFKTDRVDIAVGIATPTAQSLANASRRSRWYSPQ